MMPGGRCSGLGPVRNRFSSILDLHPHSMHLHLVGKPGLTGLDRCRTGKKSVALRRRLDSNEVTTPTKDLLGTAGPGSGRLKTVYALNTMSKETVASTRGHTCVAGKVGARLTL